jgi:hypothetical protein
LGEWDKEKGLISTQPLYFSDENVKLC